MAHTDAGSKFVFDEAYTDHLFAMKVSHYYSCVNISSFLRFIQHHCSEWPRAQNTRQCNKYEKWSTRSISRLRK